MRTVELVISPTVNLFRFEVYAIRNAVAIMFKDIAVNHVVFNLTTIFAITTVPIDIHFGYYNLFWFGR